MFFGRFSPPTPPPPQTTEKDDLITQKEALLTHIRALDFDLETGKISAEDHERERSQLMHNAADILRQIDHLPETAQRDINAEIEAAIAQLRQRTEVCPHCAEAVPVGNQFCGKCGGAL